MMEISGEEIEFPEVAHAETQWRRAIADRLARRDHAPTPKGAIP